MGCGPGAESILKRKTWRDRYLTSMPEAPLLSASLTAAAALAGVTEYPPMRPYCIHARRSRLGACAEIASQDGNALAKTLAFAHANRPCNGYHAFATPRPALAGSQRSMSATFLSGGLEEEQHSLLPALPRSLSLTQNV